MKKIAITSRLINAQNYYEQREALDSQWGALFKELNFLPIVLLSECDFEDYFNELKIDGVLLTGGNDLNHLNPNELSEKRDTFENNLIRHAIINKLPIFGVCRGMQVIAEYFSSSFKTVDNEISNRHGLRVNRSSKYCELLEKIVEVNSFHHYAVDRVGAELMVSARNEKNVIKAIEHKELKIFGQMWHSERENPFDKNELNLMESFFND